MAKRRWYTVIECTVPTLYIIFYLCYGHYLTTSFLALKGFQDSNLPVHVDEYFNFHLGVRCRCPRHRHLSSSLSCKFRKAFCIWNESQWMLVKHKQTIKRASEATPAHSFSLCQTPMHSLIRSPRMPSHASHSQNVSHSEISLHSISIAHIPVITLYRVQWRWWCISQSTSKLFDRGK